MKQRWSLAVPLTGVLLAASLTCAQAAIHLNLETPPSTGGNNSGIQLVRGWTFADNGNPVTVKARIDGVTTSVEIDCCGPRGDVQGTVAGAPLNTGFSAVINYGDLLAGPHMVGVEVSATGEATVVSDHKVVVIRPGNVSLVTTFDLSSAACSVGPQANDILITGAKVGGSSGTPVTTNMTVAYQLPAQALAITEASGGPALTFFKATLNQSQEVPTPTPTTATGTAVFTLNANNSLTCSLVTTNLTGGLAAHIHQADPGVAGDIIIPLDGGPTTWSCPSTVLTADQLTALKTGGLYVNAHTTANQPGEIRGQIVVAGSGSSTPSTPSTPGGGGY